MDKAWFWVPPDLDPCTASAWGWVLEALGATCGWGGLDGRGRVFGFSKYVDASGFWFGLSCHWLSPWQKPRHV